MAPATQIPQLRATAAFGDILVYFMTAQQTAVAIVSRMSMRAAELINFFCELFLCRSSMEGMLIGMPDTMPPTRGLMWLPMYDIAVTVPPAMTNVEMYSRPPIVLCHECGENNLNLMAKELWWI